MEICPSPPITQNDRPRSIIIVKNLIRLGHDEYCNCCCCCTPQSACLKYKQPEVPKSFKPLRHYWKNNIPMERNTTYKLSYWEGETCPSTKPFRPENYLTVGDGPMTNDTTHKMSYLGNWCVTPEKPIIPCVKALLGRGPMENNTTQKLSYTWKNEPRSKPFKLRGTLSCSCASMSDDTTYKLSYYESGCRIPVTSFKPSRRYERSEEPMDGCTTYKLSYWPNEVPIEDEQPWNKKQVYHPPLTPIEDCTTYRLSYWPNIEPVRKPFALKENENLLNRGCCFDDKTTYNSSYFGCGGETRDPIKPAQSTYPSTSPLSHDTIHKMSYLGNWCVQPEKPCVPCTKNWMGRGLMDDKTTQKLSFTWKDNELGVPFHPEDNLQCSTQPLECCTTNRLSYFPNDTRDLIEKKSFKPIRHYSPSGIPMEGETTMKLSFQPVENTHCSKKPCPSSQKYNPPLTPIDDETTYNLSFIPPGTFEPVCFPSQNISCNASESS